MGFGVYDLPAVAQGLEEFAELCFGASGLLSAVLYVIRALSLHTIAGRRGLSKPWLAWLPVCWDWLLGSVSDQYAYLTAGKIQSRRKALLGLDIAGVLCGAVSCVTTLVVIVLLFESSAARAATALLGVLLMWLVTAAVGIAAYVLRCMSLYGLYKSCDPENAAAYLVIGILISITEPFFLLYCRNKDGGMPPRKPRAPVQPEPVPEPCEEPETDPVPEETDEEA